MALHLIDHPLVAHYLTRLRDRDTTPDEFREKLQQSAGASPPS